MASQKNLKARSEPHADTHFSRCCIKKSCFKKVLLLLAVAQAVGIIYLYRQNRRTPAQREEAVSTMSTPVLPRNKIGSIFHLPLTQAKDMSRFYSEVREGLWCLTAGTRSVKDKNGKCDCHDGWMGLDCGIPPAVWNSEFIARGTAKGVQIRRRHHPRRIIYSLVYNGDSELLNHTMSYLGGIVESFLIGETSPADPSKLSSEISPHFADKIVYISLGSYSLGTGNLLNFQKEMWMKGKKVMSDFRPDDVVVLTDLVSVPSKEVLTFLKLYEGFSEPIRFKLAPSDLFHNVSGGSGSSQKGVPLSTDTMGCTFEYLRYLCTYDASLVWSYDYISRKEECSLFEKNNWPLRQWTVGSTNFPAGLVCHFCTSVLNMTTSQVPSETNGTKINVTTSASTVLEGNATKVQ